MTTPGELRIGDADRERAIAELRRAAEDGRLTAEELDDRVGRARRARTANDLTALLADLHPGPALPGPVPTVAAALAALADVGHRRDGPLVLKAGLDGVKRTGDWLVPPFLRAQAGMETVRIDCLRARAAAEVIELDIQAVAGTVVLVLPEGWAANADRLAKGIGTVRVKVPGVPAPGCPLFLVHGSLGMGTFKARPANRFERWRLRRQERRQRRELTA